MRTSDLLKETYSALTSNKSRSGLTILGIVIGIASVIAMISIGQGVTSNIESNIQSLGSNLLIVMPGSSRGLGASAREGRGSATTLIMSDVEAIKQSVNSIKTVAPVVSTRKQVTSRRGTNTNTSIYGITTDYFSVKNITTELGNLLTDLNINNSSKVAVLGPTTRNDLFGESSDPVGQKIRIGNQEFTIIGVTISKGGSGMNNSDDLIYVPITTAQRYITGSESVSIVNIEVTEAKLIDQVNQAVSDLLMERHDISDINSADFSIMNQADVLNTMSSVSGTLTLLLGAIAGISLVVGGIGIMNMMLTTVTERTREIGLRKSLGAKNKDISTQFLAEAIVLTSLGGIIGIIIGCVVAVAISKFGGLTTQISTFSIFLAAGVSGAIGLIFGYYPARRAAKLNPIEALRYE
jgi:putative ABC transport system permease protein